MSLFGEPQTVKGIRAYTEDMETWMKNGAMVVFEGQVGTLRFRKSSRYTETAVDFVPVDEGKYGQGRRLFPHTQGVFRAVRQGTGRTKGVLGTA